MKKKKQEGDKMMKMEIEINDKLVKTAKKHGYELKELITTQISSWVEKFLREEPRPLPSLEDEMGTIKNGKMVGVTGWTKHQLEEFKKKYGCKSMDTVIKVLLYIYHQYKDDTKAFLGNDKFILSMKESAEAVEKNYIAWKQLEV